MIATLSPPQPTDLSDEVARTDTAEARTSTSPHFENVAKHLRSLSQVSSWRGVTALAFDWAVISASFAVAVAVPNPLVWILCAIVIAARQHALLILMHDAAHYRFLSNRTWNDRLSNWFCAWPLLVSTEGYRHNHIAHHVHLNTEDDPDWVRKDGKEDWRFPKTKSAFCLLLLRELCGGGFLQAIASIRDLSGEKRRAAAEQSAGWTRLLYYALAAGLTAISGLWVPVLLLWFLPAFTILTVILRIRSIAEHFGVENEHDLNNSRNVHVAWWERFLLAPHHCGYHLDHHLYPSVPFYNLPKLHELLQSAEQYRTSSHQTNGFFGRTKSSFLQEISANA